MNILAHSLCTTIFLGQILRNKIVCQKEYDEFQLIVPNGFTNRSDSLQKLYHFTYITEGEKEFCLTSFYSNFELFTNLISEVLY